MSIDMKALILVGGYGTRLRPLTLSVPKPLISFCNKSIVEHQIAALVKAGVDHVILAVAYQSNTMDDALEELEAKFKIKITCSRENEPLGTAGPIALARDLLVGSEENSKIDKKNELHLKKKNEINSEKENEINSEKKNELNLEKKNEINSEKENEDSFFVCNSDVICNFPFSDLLKFHKLKSAEATILVTKVEDPMAFGVVIHDENNKVTDFVEKPKEPVGYCINAGIYLLSRSVIDRIKPVPTSIEHDTFPQIVKDGGLFCMLLDGYWADIGKPPDFLKGMKLYLEDECKNGVIDDTRYTEKYGEKRGNVLIHPSATLGKGCIIGPNVTIDAECVIGEGCRLAETAVMSGVSIKAYSWINGSILGWQSRIGRWVRIEGLTVVGEDVQIADECYLNGVCILPHKNISASIHKAGTIIM